MNKKTNKTSNYLLHNMTMLNFYSIQGIWYLQIISVQIFTVVLARGYWRLWCIIKYILKKTVVTQYFSKQCFWKILSLNAVLVLTSNGIVQFQSIETKKSAPPSPIGATGKKAACRERGREWDLDGENG